MIFQSVAWMGLFPYVPYFIDLDEIWKMRPKRNAVEHCSRLVKIRNIWNHALLEGVNEISPYTTV
jgi:hypothetical protein